MPTVLITGGTGLIGKAIQKLLLQNGYEVIVLSRKKNSTPGMAYWNVEEQTIDTAAIQNADHIIHLTGAGVADKRWSAKRKSEILQSRTQSSALLVKALKEIPNKVQTVISASAIGWYRPTPLFPQGENIFRVEIEHADESFLGNTCLQWEQSIEPVINLGKRLVKLRTGIVLSNDGGAYAEFKKPLRFGIAAILSNGRQAISWIHIDDLCRMYLAAIENKEMHGAYNAVAPKPVSNKTLTLTLAKTMRGNAFIPVHVPAFVLKLMLGEMSVEVLKSANISAEKIRKSGFHFVYPTIDAAVNALVNEKK